MNHVLWGSGGFEQTIRGDRPLPPSHPGLQALGKLSGAGGPRWLLGTEWRLCAPAGSHRLLSSVPSAGQPGRRAEQDPRAQERPPHQSAERLGGL